VLRLNALDSIARRGARDFVHELGVLGQSGCLAGSRSKLPADGRVGYLPYEEGGDQRLPSRDVRRTAIRPRGGAKDGTQPRIHPHFGGGPRYVAPSLPRPLHSLLVLSSDMAPFSLPSLRQRESEDRRSSLNSNATTQDDQVSVSKSTDALAVDGADALRSRTGPAAAGKPSLPAIAEVDAAAAFLQTAEVEGVSRGGPVTPEENARVLRKIDLNLTPILVAIYFLQALDKATLGFSAVFGLQNDTHLIGNQYNWLGRYVCAR
jgi:hypothetical protein